MFLKKINSNNINVKNEVRMEKVVDDLLMISIKIDLKNNKDYYDYWRLTKTMGIPPLEIGIDRTDGSIQTIVYYIDSDYFNKINFIKPEENDGLVLIDTSIFKKENDYVDVDSDYYVFFSDNEEFICSFDRNFNPDESYNIDRVKIFLRFNKIIGFSIANLTDIEITELESIQ